MLLYLTDRAMENFSLCQYARIILSNTIAEPKRCNKMQNFDKSSITVSVIVHAPVEKVWASWTDPQHITQWNHASDDWHTPKAENDLRAGGTFSYRMEARDGSFGFDFGGEYTQVRTYEKIAFSLGDGRKVEVLFSASVSETIITETFEAESLNSYEKQKAGWQAILNNFKKYTEGI